ncbi:hypothetical protein COOONC_25110 [Cooperia oncophora]
MPFLAAIAEIAAARYERSLVLLRKCIEDDTLSETFRGMLRDIRVDILSRLRHPVFLDALSCPAEFSLWNENEKLEGHPEGYGMHAETFTSGLTAINFFSRAEVASMRENVANTARLVLMTDGGQRLHGRLAVLNQLADVFWRKWAEKDDRSLNSNAAVLSDLAASFLVENGETYDAGERLRLGRQLALWAERLGCSSPAHLHLPLAKLARKTGNPMLAGVHLHKASNNPVLINNSPVLNSLKVAVQGTKMMWEIASPEQRARSFVTVFATLQGGYEMMCHSYQVIAANVNMNGDMEECREMMGCDLVGSLLAVATEVAPTLGKAHRKLGDWAFNSAESADNEKDRLLFSKNYRFINEVTVISRAFGPKYVNAVPSFTIYPFRPISPTFLRTWAAKRHFTAAVRSAIPSGKRGSRIIAGTLVKALFSAPHAIVFQAVAGASSSMLVASEDDVIETNEKEDDESSSKERCLMFEGCRVLVSVLEGHYPDLVKDVREFVNELQRINLLNEERLEQIAGLRVMSSGGPFVLANLDHEMEKRLEQIRAESEKTVNTAHLDEKTRLDIIAEKSRLITSSVYRILDDLYERTCLREPTTQNERAFVQLYGEKLQSVFEQSRANRKSPEKSWAPFKHMLGILLQKNSRRGGHSLQMPEISPILSELSKSNIPIPGQENIEFSEVVTIDRVVKNALVLPTKTRPKKIAFIGSEGKEHMFLFKGQEDLHLDERIMQLLHICNLMLAGNSSSR